MDGKSHVAILALALASAAFAGCIEAPGFLNVSEVEVSALENRGLADDAAKEWNANAALVSVMAFELTTSEEERIQADPEVGNGLAPAWWYVYCAFAEEETEAKAEDGGAEDGPSTVTKTKTASMGVPEVRAFKVTADGTVTSEDEVAAMAMGDYEHDMAGDLDAWKVDSVLALDAAKADESFRKVAEGFNASVVEGVAHHEGQTAWWFAAISADGFVVATVDAVTGDLLEVQSLDATFTVPTFEWGARDPEMWTAEPILVEGSGYAAPGEEPAEHPLDVAAPMHGMLIIDFESQLPTDGLHWAILDEDGELIDADHLRSWTGGGNYEQEIGIEEPGQYTFTLFYMGSAPFAPPVGPGGIDYVFTLDLVPGHMEHDEHEG